MKEDPDLLISRTQVLHMPVLCLFKLKYVMCVYKLLKKCVFYSSILFCAHGIVLKIINMLCRI